MDSPRALILFVLILAAFIGGQYAYAQIVGYSIKSCGWYTVSTCEASRATCEASVASLGIEFNRTYTKHSTPTVFCDLINIYYCPLSYPYYYNNVCNKTCPAGTTPNPSTGKCIQNCPDGLPPEPDGSCNRPCPQAGSPYGGIGYFPATKTSSGFRPSVHIGCVDGCNVTFNGTCPAGASLVAGQPQYYCYGQYTYLGGTKGQCTTANVPTGTSAIPTDTCGPNQVSGTVNGNTVCVNKSDGSTTQNPTEIKKKQIEYSNDSNGNTIQKEVTQGPNGETVVTKTYDPSGKLISEETKSYGPEGEEDKGKSFCEENPESFICLERQAGGGLDCDTPPTCSGDEIACAQLTQQWMSRCTKDDELVQLSKAATNTNNVMLSSSQLGLPSQFTVNSYLGTSASSCPLPSSIPVLGNNVTLPYDPCDLASFVRMLVTVTALLFAMRIIFNTGS